jgi:hypothetical protein
VAGPRLEHAAAAVVDHHLRALDPALEVAHLPQPGALRVGHSEQGAVAPPLAPHLVAPVRQRHHLARGHLVERRRLGLGRGPLQVLRGGGCHHRQGGAGGDEAG